MKIKKLFFAFLLAVGLMPLFSRPVYAASLCDNLFNQFQITVNGNKTNIIEGLPRLCTPEQAIGNVIALLLQFAAVVSVLFIMLGGYWYLTAAGNDEQTEKGRKALTSAIIGLVVIILSYALVRVTVDFLTNSLGGSSNSGNTTTTNPNTSNPTSNPNTANPSGGQPGGQTGGSTGADEYGLTDTQYNSYVAGPTNYLDTPSANISNGNLTITSSISASDIEAIKEVDNLCQRSFPPYLSATAFFEDGSSKEYGPVDYNKSSNIFAATLTGSYNSTNGIKSIRFKICNQPFAFIQVSSTR